MCENNINIYSFLSHLLMHLLCHLFICLYTYIFYYILMWNALVTEMIIGMVSLSCLALRGCCSFFSNRARALAG